MEVAKQIETAPMSSDPFSYVSIIKNHELQAAVPNDSRFENLSSTLKTELREAVDSINDFCEERFVASDSVESLSLWLTDLPKLISLEEQLFTLLRLVPRERGWLRLKEARRIRDFVKLRTGELEQLRTLSLTINRRHYAMVRHSDILYRFFGYTESELVARRVENIQKLRNGYFLAPTLEHFNHYLEAVRDFHELVPYYESDEYIRGAAENALDELEVAVLMDDLA